jgi:hypothetical protein
MPAGKRTLFKDGMVIKSSRPTATATGTATVLTDLLRFSVVLDPASVAAATSAEQTVTCTGVAVGDIVIAVNKPSTTAGVGIVNARVTAANTVGLTFMNATAGAVDPASETYQIVVARFDTS